MREFSSTHLSSFLPSRKTSWCFLVLLFVFDNFFSYYAITRLGGREGNLIIAPFVEKYPILYFLCIPLTVLIMFYLFKTILWASLRLLHRGVVDEKILEQIILGALVIYWAAGNSFMNLSFLLGHRLPLRTWALTSLAGVLLASTYASLMLQKLSDK